MYAAMEELHHHNQTLEDNVVHLQLHQHEGNSIEDMEILDPSFPL